MTKPMNKTQASRLLTLALFIKTLKPEQLDQRSYDNEHGGRCAFGWCAEIWPKIFVLKGPFDMHMNGVEVTYMCKAVAKFFGTDMLDVFGGASTTPKQKFRQIVDICLAEGWTL